MGERVNSFRKCVVKVNKCFRRAKFQMAEDSELFIEDLLLYNGTDYSASESAEPQAQPRTCDKNAKPKSVLRSPKSRSSPGVKKSVRFAPTKAELTELKARNGYRTDPAPANKVPVTTKTVASPLQTSEAQDPTWEDTLRQSIPNFTPGDYATYKRCTVVIEEVDGEDVTFSVPYPEDQK